jgi:HAD superfamily hydrolase (TIGR01509 family)
VSRLQALLWDVDGVLAETERDGHRIAFNRAFEACGLPWQWSVERYGELLRISGGRERLLHDMHGRSSVPALPDEREALAREVHALKNRIYAGLVAQGRIRLRDGVLPLMRECRGRGIRMGIVTTTSRSNLEALMQAHLGEGWPAQFAVTVCGEDVARKKPDPQAYRVALAALGLAASRAVAIEDAPGGAAAAHAAGLPVVVTRSAYFADEPIDDAVAIGPGLHQRRGWRPQLSAAFGDGATVRVADLERWMRGARPQPSAAYAGSRRSSRSP